MHDLYNDLSEMCETLEGEVKKTNAKIEKAGGQLTGSDIEYIDKLTHALKSIKTTKAMIEAEEDGMSFEGGSYARGEGNRGGGRSSRGSYAQGGNMGGGNMGGGSMGGSSMGRGGSYARGRGRYAKRDSMGRYSSERGYSGDTEELVEELRDLMEDAPDESIKMEFQRLIQKMEQM